jgi:hypothetical protein
MARWNGCVAGEGRVGRRGAILALAMAVAASAAPGCAYLKNRGNDALDIFDIGLTVSRKPGVSLYCGCLNLIPIGYASVEGTLMGLGERQVGLLPARQHAAGVLLWGAEQFAYGVNFQREAPNSPPDWRIGAIGLAEGPRPPGRHLISCPKTLHLGFIGITITCKPNEALDFLLGWGTLDIMKDDVYPEPSKGQEPKASARP